VSSSVVKWSEGLSNRASIIIRRYIDHMKLAVYMAVSLITIFMFFCSILYRCIYGCMFCMLLFNLVKNVFLLLGYVFLILRYVFLMRCCVVLLLCIILFMYYYCYACSVLGILFHCAGLCTICVCMCSVLLPTGVNPIAVKIYHIISWRKNKDSEQGSKENFGLK
jgi:hypothetical protein